MGGKISSQASLDEEFLTAEENCKLQAIFTSSRKKKDAGQHVLKEEDLKTLWKGKLEDNLLERLMKYFFSNKDSPSKQSGLTFHQFVELFVHAVRGTVEEKAVMIAAVSSGKTDGASSSEITEYVKEIIASYIKAEESTKQYKTWLRSGCTQDGESVKLLASSLVHDLVFPDKSCKDTWLLAEEHRDCNLVDLQRWLMTCSDLAAMQAAVFERLYFGAETPVGDDAICLFPLCRGVGRGAGDEPFPSVLDMTTVTFLNAALPGEVRDQWRFLFSSKLHGESFSKLLGSVVGKGPSILIIQDKDGHIFGGFATESWNLGPKFVGNENCFLFSLRPKLNIYRTTGYNNHYMYLNVQQQTMPNGLGMGGVLEYFGLFLDASYGTGMCAETCTTYHSPMMSGIKNFEIAHTEVWGVGPPPKSPTELGERPSILDKDNEAKAILAMAGKGGHSDGFREKEDIFEG